MPYNLFAFAPKTIIANTPRLNSLNGNDAEYKVASTLVTACHGEIEWSSRSEDGRKIDLFLSLDHPWYPSERMLVLIQVKSGESYGQITRDAKMKKVATIKPKAFDEAKRTTHPICLIWVDREEWELFWYFVHPNTRANKCRIGEIIHSITPATRFDLARCYGRFMPTTTGGKGIVIKEISSSATMSVQSKAKYKKQKKDIICPVLGKIELTRKGWRHMTRKTRSTKRIKSSLETIPYIRQILARIPSTHWITSAECNLKGIFITREVEHVLRYDDVHFVNSKNELQSCSVVIRVAEAIRYPKNWNSTDHSEQLIKRRVVLLNAYHKLDK